MNAEKRLDPWIEGYLAYLKDIRRNAKGTLIDKRCTFHAVVSAMEVIRPNTPLWKLTLEDYLRWVEREREAKHSPASISKCLSHIRGLLEYTWRAGKAERNVLDGLLLQDACSYPEARSLSLAEAAELVEACRRQTRSLRVMVLLLYGCGLRTRELCGLDVQDLDHERREIEVRHGKGDVQRRIPVPDPVWTELLAHVGEMKRKRGPLFRGSGRQRRINSAAVCEAVRQVTVAAGIAAGVTPKTLRHTFATHLLERGVDLGVVASLMGHRSPRETNTYLHSSAQKREAAVRKIGPRGKDQP